MKYTTQYTTNILQNIYTLVDKIQRAIIATTCMMGLMANAPYA